MASEKDLDGALKMTRDLVERLNAARRPGKGGAKPTPNAPGSMGFFDRKLGSLWLPPAEAKAFGECRDALVALYGRNPELRERSADDTRSLLQTTVLRALRPKLDAADREKFRRRLEREIGRLRRELTRETVVWLVATKIHGMECDPVQEVVFGGIRFGTGSDESAARLAGRISSFEPTRKFSERNLALQKQIRECTRADVVRELSGAAIASVTVPAIDSEAAVRSGIGRIRLVVDVLNFLAPIVENDGPSRRAFFPPDGERHWAGWLAHTVIGEPVSFLQGGPLDWPVTMQTLARELAVDSVASRASAVLTSVRRTDLEQRIVNALGWAGRAETAYRRDESFLLHAIALEALLTKPSSRVGVTDRLRLRITHLLGTDARARKTLHERVGRLYSLRSEIVHAGDSTNLGEEEVKLMRGLTRMAIVRVLTEEPFRSMRSAGEFERWLDERLFG